MLFWAITALFRDIGDIVIGHLVLRDAQLKVVCDLSTRRHRLIFLGKNQTTSACIERKLSTAEACTRLTALKVSEDFLVSLIENGQPRAQSYLAQLVDVQEDGISIAETSIELDLLSPLKNEREFWASASDFLFLSRMKST